MSGRHRGREPRRGWRGPWLGLLGLLALTACTPGAPEAERARATAMLPVSLPNLSRMDEVVQTQILDEHAALVRIIEDPTAATADRAAAYGRMGMLLHAAESLDAAEPYYRNARTLAPGDARWPYYLGHLYKSQGHTDPAVDAFRRALDLRPNDVAILVWLGRLYHELGRPDDAEPLFARAEAAAPNAVAVLAGLGQAALAREDYAAAARHLEQALAVDPQASAVHSPLAMAYRALGDLERAEAHARRWENREILLHDPLKEQLELTLESGLSYEVRGVRALEAEQWDQAADLFRKGIALTPATTPLGRSLRHKLGTALAMTGDTRGAIGQFEDVVRASPGGQDEATARAHYSLGLLAGSAGSGAEAIEHFQAAVDRHPNYMEARVALADALRRSGRAEASLAHYQEAVAISPRDAAYARYGYGMALVRLERYREARDWLTDAVRVHAGQPHLTHALARVLAGAPDAQVRDGQRALLLVEELMTGERTLELGETLAMSHAALGNFQDAIAIQRDVMAAAQQAGQHDVRRRMEENLRAYERREPSRRPWREDDPVHLPGPPAAE